MIERSLIVFQNYKNSINNWKSHLLRSVNQNMAREYHLSSLSDDSVFIYLDWAMKWLPAKYREPQPFFFGKRRLSWHITVVIKKSQINADIVLGESDSENNFSSDEEESKCTKNSFSQKIFVHVFDNCSEDSRTVLCIIENVLKEIKLSDPLIIKAFLRSDKAGRYHSAETLLLLPYVLKRIGIELQCFDFSDPQNGRSSCDWFAAVLKYRVGRFLYEKKDIINASEFVNVCRLHGETLDVKIFECRLVVEPKSTIQFKFRSITSYKNFKFETDGILVHRAWSVGPGKLFSFKDLKFDEKSINQIVKNSLI